MKWQPYPGYKPSGLEWLGEVPEDWGVLRLKNIARFSYGDSLAAGDRIPGNYDVYGSNGIVDQHERPNTKGPCLIIGRKGSFGKVAYSEHPCFAIDTTYFIDSTLTRNDLRWLYYCLQWLRLDSFTKDSAVPGLSREDAYENFVPFCPINNQRAIAAFLDRETARIDALMEKKQRQIELLQEKRAALISHAVTQGLDPTVPLKDSGIEWMGQIPAHWELGKLKHITSSIQTGPFGSQLHAGEYVDDGIPAINPSNLQNGTIVPDWRCCVDEEIFARLKRHRLDEGDIVFARRGEMGRCALVTREEDGWLCGTGSIRIRINKENAYPPFVYQVLSTPGVRDWLFLESVGSTMDNLNTEIMSQIPILLPPLDEQIFIVGEIERHVQQIDNLKTKIQKSIDRLKEYRTALISAAVTGKIDVREGVA
jgi:type I restriction enzyme S subunit